MFTYFSICSQKLVIFTISNQISNKMGIKLENGYETKTTFLQDFIIAEHFGLDAVEDTFKRSFRDWKDNLEYVTELAMVMSWRSCYWYEKNELLMNMYSDFYHKVDYWCMNHLKGPDLIYYLNTTD